ncbi:MAG: hypothetical protein A4E52_02234 [Pelotomaculum sp. PtaB.Bin013]|nr:MAG: hypothetical protein A4E52_02234 [Pelotomaculum sp. PtaB.Bin013]
MDNDEILNICYELFDSIIIIKGYIKLNIRNKKVNYSIILIQEIKIIETLVRKILDIVNPLST